MAEQIADRQDLPADVATEVAAALAEPAFASLARAGAPIVVAEGDPARVVHASASALALFAVTDREELTQRLFASDEPGARRLGHLAQAILPGAAARLERLSLRFDLLPETVTFLCRRTPGEKPLFVLAGLGLRVGQSRTVQAPALSAPASSGQEFDVPVSPAAGKQVPLAPALAETAGLDALRADLERRYPGLAPARFLWRADAANIVTEVTPPLADIVGPGCANIVGRNLASAAAALGLDRQGKLAAALQGRATFSGVELDWPIDEAAAAAPVTLGALPTFGGDRAFEGWRGFGVIHLDRLHPAALTAGLPPQVASPPAAETRAADPHPEASPVMAPEFSGVVAPSTSAPEFSGVVVPLRPLVQLRQPPAVVEDRPEEAGKSTVTRDGGDEKVLVTLAPHERNAFREIARTLGARTGDAVLEVPQELPEDRPVEAEALRAESGDAPSPGGNLLDALPIGLLVAHGDSAVFANRLLLDWLGFDDLQRSKRPAGCAPPAPAACSNSRPRSGAPCCCAPLRANPSRWTRAAPKSCGRTRRRNSTRCSARRRWRSNNGSACLRRACASARTRLTRPWRFSTRRPTASSSSTPKALSSD